MKLWKVLPTVAVVIAALFACSLENPWTGSSSGGPVTLPPDIVLDVARSYDQFTYETLLPVKLNLSVKLYESSPDSKSLETTPADEELVIVTIKNKQGSVVYAGRVSDDGALHAVVPLPAAPEDMELTLEAPGFKSRTVTIREMVQYAEINREMGLLADTMTAKGDSLLDSDLDGIPDVYDAYPLDPDVAFTVRNPAEGSLTVAYEDLYPVPGDADYNDFVARYFVVENYANIKVPKEPEEIEEELEKDKPVEKDEELVEQTELVSLYGEATAVDKVAGYNHRFGIVIDFPDLTADLLEVTYYDSAGALRSATFEDVENQAVIWLFENTKYAKDKDQPATFFLQFYDGVDRSGVSYAPYDPVLQVISNGPSKAYDIHLIGEDPFPDGVDTQHLDFIDGNGYPWALLVPDDWKHPAECQYIGNAYPLFDDWRLSSGEKFAYWYLYPVDTNTEPDNHPPAVVTDETGERKSNPELVAGAADEQHYQLELDADEPDPDEDDVYFLSSPLPEGLADKMILDETTGMVTFTAEVPEDDYLVYFWSEDEHHASTISDPFKVTFSFRSGVANTPPVASFPGDYEVVAAGNTAVIGRYEIVGTNEGRPLYQQVTDLNVQPYYLYYLTADDFGDTALWVIHAAVGTMAAGAQYYNSDASASTAPEGQWDAVEASGTATGRRLPISGSLNVGGTLTVRYQYSDADGDEQDLEATEIRWLRFDSETAITGKVILGAVTDTYTTTMEDAGKWLRVEVTPVDKREAVGDPALSSAVYIGGS